MITKARLNLAFHTARVAAGQGNQFDRLMAVINAVLAVAPEFRALDASRVRLMEVRQVWFTSHRPDDADAVIDEISDMILNAAKTFRLSTAEVKPVAWAVSLKSLDRFGYSDARLVQSRRPILVHSAR